MFCDSCVLVWKSGQTNRRALCLEELRLCPPLPVIQALSWCSFVDIAVAPQSQNYTCIADTGCSLFFFDQTAVSHKGWATRVFTQNFNVKSVVCADHLYTMSGDLHLAKVKNRIDSNFWPFHFRESASGKNENSKESSISPT